MFYGETIKMFHGDTIKCLMVKQIKCYMVKVYSNFKNGYTSISFHWIVLKWVLSWLSYTFWQGLTRWISDIPHSFTEAIVIAAYVFSVDVTC